MTRRSGSVAPTDAAPTLVKRASPFTDNPEAYIAGDRRRALGTGTAMPDRTSGSAIFADISGFTPLTEALAAELGQQRGAEELTAALDVIFDAVLGELHRFGGSVIYFSGDAVTCWLEGDDGTRGVACGLAMQRAMARVSRLQTPGGVTVELAMKVAVAAGDARRFVVGDPDIQLIDVLAGVLMDRLAASEHHCEKGEVVVDAQTLANLAGRIELGLIRGDGSDRVGVVASLVGVTPAAPPRVPYPRLPRAVVRQWLLPAVYERMSAGRGEFLSELRPAVPMFMRFGGIDYDADPDAPARLDDFIQRAQRVIDGYGGNVLQLTVGDKGSYLYAVFGSPLAHEDDASRACRAALDVLALEGQTAVTGLQIGVAQGRLRSGTYGHRQRRTFCCLGDAVNLAARLMSAAPPGQVYVAADAARVAAAGLDFAELPDLKVKGKAAAVAVRRLDGRRSAAPRRIDRSGPALIGRAAELARLEALAEQARAGSGQVVAVVAEAGMGKSRLVAELLSRPAAAASPVFVGEAASVGGTSYLAWQGIWSAMFGITDVDDPLPVIEAALAAADASLVVRLPLLSAVLGIAIDDNSLTSTFDAKLRKSSLESLLVRYVSVRATHGPVTLVIEDCHWLDPLSRDLLTVIARAVATLPVLVVLTHRPGSFEAPKLGHTTTVALDRLDETSSLELFSTRVQQLYGAGHALSPALSRLLTDRADGNPLYIEELLNFLHASGVDPSDDHAAKSLDLPTSLSSLVLSRLDTLPEAPRRVLKVASVVGRDFGIDALVGAYSDLGDRSQVGRMLGQLRESELVVLEPAGDGYAFKHGVIRDVAYDSLPFALRATLHGRVGTWLEVSDPDALDLLAHHFWFSTDEDRKRTYLVRAGEAAQARYANEAAVDYFRRVMPLLAPADRGAMLLRLGSVLEILGEWVGAEQAYLEALDLAVDAGAAHDEGLAHTAMAEVMRKEGRYEPAAAELDAAERKLVECGDRPGLARVAHLRGTLAAQAGDYPAARAYYTAGLEIRGELDDVAGMAALLSNLAIVAEYEGDYTAAAEFNERALALRIEVADPWAIAVSHNNLGMIALLSHDHAAARERFEATLDLAAQVGDTWMAAIARNNLGNANRDLGDLASARRHYAEALATQSILGDRWALAILYDDIAVLAVQAGESQAAMTLVGAADSLHAELGAPRSPATQAELDARLAPAHESLGTNRAEQAKAEGRALNAAAHGELAVNICGEFRQTQ